jgi:phosphoribosylpyrophosphate synthetase
VHGFFSVPVDHLHALRELATHFRGRDLSHATVVSPGLGYAKSAAAFARRLAATDVTEIVCTNSVPLIGEHPKLTVLSVAPALAEAISRIHDGESVSSLFDH